MVYNQYQTALSAFSIVTDIVAFTQGRHPVKVAITDHVWFLILTDVMV